jgi:hypothetical protein
MFKHSCSTVLSLFFSKTPKHISTFAPTCQEFKNSAVTEVRISYWHPSTNSHFHCLVTLEQSISQLLLQRHKHLTAEKSNFSNMERTEAENETPHEHKDNNRKILTACPPHNCGSNSGANPSLQSVIPCYPVPDITCHFYAHSRKNFLHDY